MSKSREEILSAMEPAKALTLGCYGEDMAAYCYLQLAEKAEREQDRREFSEMVAEEQEHRDRLRTLLDKHYPGSDFVLSPEEKQIVEGGARSLHITDRRSFEEAVRGVVASEAMTARFYRQMARHTDQPDVKAIFQELADEGVTHHKRLLQLAAENNIDIP